MWNKRAKYAGLAIFTLAIVCVATGVFMTFKGATLNNRAIWLAHVLVDAARARRVHPPPPRAHPQAPVPAPLRLGRRRRRLPRRDGGPREAREAAEARSSTSTATPSSSRPPPRRSTRACSTARSSPRTTTASQCHPDSFHQWERSAHRFSSFNNPFYRKSVELMADRVGRERTKWCSGCHDPVVLFTGQMGAATQAKFSYDSFEAQQGLTCMSCHSIAEVKDLTGNGSYVIEESQAVPVRVLEEQDARGGQPAPDPHGAVAPPQDVHEARSCGRRSSARRATRSRSSRRSTATAGCAARTTTTPGTTPASRAAPCAPSTTRRSRRPAATATCRRSRSDEFGNQKG